MWNSFECIYNKQTNLKGLYSWNKMWPLKNLAMLKCENKTSLHVYSTI